MYRNKAEQVGQFIAEHIDEAAAKRGITPETAHQHTLTHYTHPDGTEVFTIDGEPVLSFNLQTLLRFDP